MTNPRCTARKHDGTGQCRKPAITGGTVCSIHGGMAKQVKAKADIRATATAAIADIGLGDIDIDPGEVVLHLLARGWAKTTMLTAEHQRMIEEFGIHDATVGKAMVVDAEGDVHQVGEYVRGLAEAELRWSKYTADLALKAQAAGLAERQVELAERERALMTEILRVVLFDPALGLTMAQRAAVPALIRGHLGITSTPAVVEVNSDE